MKLHYKLMAAAVALATAGSAAAVMNNFASGNGSLILNVVDMNKNVSATFDLGMYLNGFLPGSAAATTTQSWDLASNANYSAAWNSFAAATAGDSANVLFNVIAGDSVSVRYLSTTNADLTAASNKPTNSQLAQFSGVDLFVNQANLSGNQPGTTPGADFVSDPNSSAYVASGSAFGTTGKWFVNKSPFVTWTGFDTALNFYEFTKNGTSGLTKATISPYSLAAPYTFTLGSNGTLTYGTAAAVPEADTYAMLLAGLGLVGVVVRRRKA